MDLRAQRFDILQDVGDATSILFTSDDLSPVGNISGKIYTTPEAVDFTVEDNATDDEVKLSISSEQSLSIGSGAFRMAIFWGSSPIMKGFFRQDPPSGGLEATGVTNEHEVVVVKDDGTTAKIKVIAGGPAGPPAAASSGSPDSRPVS